MLTLSQLLLQNLLQTTPLRQQLQKAECLDPPLALQNQLRRLMQTFWEPIPVAAPAPKKAGSNVHKIIPSGTSERGRTVDPGQLLKQICVM